MQYKIIGIKKIVCDGDKPKNGAHLHLAYEDDNVEGQAVGNAWLNDGAYPINNIIIGGTYELEIIRYMVRKIKFIKN